MAVLTLRSAVLKPAPVTAKNNSCVLICMPYGTLKSAPHNFLLDKIAGIYYYRYSFFRGVIFSETVFISGRYSTA